MKTLNINIRIDPKTKSDIEHEAKSLGLSITSYLILLHNLHKKGSR